MFTMPWMVCAEGQGIGEIGAKKEGVLAPLSMSSSPNYHAAFYIGHFPANHRVFSQYVMGPS
jgi:hypothetical protein